MACDLTTIQVAACQSEIGRVQDEIELLQLTAQSALQWAQADNAGGDYSLEAVETRACESGIGWVQDEITLLRLIAQSLCDYGSLSFAFQVIVEGDSLSLGWPAVFEDLPENEPRAMMLNVATGGEHTDEMEAQYATWDYLVPGQENAFSVTFCLFAGANDVANYTAQPASEIFGRIQAIWAHARSKGMMVAAFTIPQGAGIVGNGRDAARNELNALIRADSSNYDVLIDIDDAFETAVGSNYYLNTTYFLVDGIHFSATGNQFVAAFVSERVHTLL